MGMLPNKRIVLLAGHYGSGKTNIAVNIAVSLKKQIDAVSLADLDIVNPYFRSKDSLDELTANGIRFIGSDYANSNVDIPALPAEMYSIVHDREQTVVIDVGGDDRGALALGRLAPSILEENDYEMWMVINGYRPLTRTAEDTAEVMREIEAAAHMTFTGIVNNSNLGADTTAQDVLDSIPYAEQTAALTGLPVKMTTVDASLYDVLAPQIPNLFPLHLQRRAV